MKYLMSQDPVDRQGPPDAIGYHSTDPATIEELTGADPDWTTGRTYRWLGLGVALVTAIVGFGFVGRSGGPPQAGGASAEASMPPPTREPAPIWSAPSPAVTPLGGAAPRIDGPVQLTVVVTSIPVSDGVELVIDGTAPSTVDAVTINIRSPAGKLIASAIAQVAVEDERPGSNGGRRAGVGTFHHRIDVPEHIPTSDWRVEISWRDGSNGVRIGRAAAVRR